MSERLFAEFEPVTTEAWEQTILKDLKGGDPKKLVTRTEDGIELKPFYRRDDARPSGPVLERKPGWEIRAEIVENTVGEAHDRARAAVEHGAEGVVFRDLTVAKEEQLAELLDGLPLERVSVSFIVGPSLAGDLARLLTASPYSPKLRGSIDASAAAPLPPQYRYFVRTDNFCAAGATRVQELAFALAGAVEYLDDAGASTPLAFLFPINSSYFSEIAKLRAARLLWRNIMTAFGVDAPVWIDARTSAWNQTLFDPHVNTLRGTTEAMSAIIGGCDSLAVLPFTGTWQKPSELSARLALNTQLILRDEAHLGKVIDPAAGCWAVEELTHEFARRAWGIFQQIEAAGGLRDAVKSGLIDAMVAPVCAERDKLIAHRRRVFVGTNQYPNLKERSGAFEVPRGRGAVPFEEIRVATELSGRTPRVLLLTRGDVKWRRARADFAANFFGCAGFDIRESSTLEPADLIVLCSSDAEYPAFATEVLAQTPTPVIVAGPPQQIAGVADYIHIRSDAVETLARWQGNLTTGTLDAA